MKRLDQFVPMIVVPLLLAPTLAMAQAQTASREAEVGERVRVFAPDLRSDRYIGRIDSLDAQAIVLDTSGARTRLGLDMGPVLVDQYTKVSIRLSSIRRIEISGGRTTRPSMIRGIWIGAVSGGLLWGAGNVGEVNPSARDFVRAVPVGAITGGVLGGLIGYLLGGERWYPAFLPR